MSVHAELIEYINRLEIIDTHEHLPVREERRPQDTDVLGEWLTHYFSSDLVSAGLSPEEVEVARDSSKDLLKRWRLVEPYWHVARSTGYGRSLDLAARELYGIDGVTRKTIGPLNEAFCAARAERDHYRYVLKEKSRILLSINDNHCQLDCDRRFLVPALRLDQVYFCPTHRRELVQEGNAVGVSVHSLGDWEEAMRRHVQRAFDEQGAVALKCGLAYDRSLYFAKTTTAEAEEEFNRLFANEHSPDRRAGIKLGKAFGDYMMHSLLALANERGLPFQFHTGIQERNGNVITDSNPTLLTNLFLEYENVKFDVFHMGYPYMLELSNLAKNFRNVFIDMCWGHIISPEAARRALAEWLDAVPANKICAFGGDYCFVDGVYGHQKLARENVATTLAQKVVDGTFDVDRAKEIAKWLFVDNPAKLFSLEDRLAAAKQE